MRVMPTHFTHSSLQGQCGPRHWALAPRGQNAAAGRRKHPGPPCTPNPTARLLSQTQHSVLKAQRKGLGDETPSSLSRWPCHQGRVQTSFVEEASFLGLTSSCGVWEAQSNTTSPQPLPVWSCALTDSSCPCSLPSRVDRPPG